MSRRLPASPPDARQGSALPSAPQAPLCKAGTREDVGMTNKKHQTFRLGDTVRIKPIKLNFADVEVVSP